jgi:hypothetical protein
VEHARKKLYCIETFANKFSQSLLMLAENRKEAFQYIKIMWSAIVRKNNNTQFNCPFASMYIKVMEATKNTNT